MPAFPVFRRAFDAGALRVVVSREPAGMRMPRHSHDVGSVTVVLDGTLVEEAEHREVVAMPGSVVVKPAGVPHANRFGPAGVLLCRVDVLEEDDELDGRALAPETYAWRWSPRGFARANATFFAETTPGRDLVGRFATALLREGMGRTAAERRAPGWIADIGRRLTLGEPSSVSSLATVAGVHRGSLARRYRAAYGCSVTEHRRRAMVERAVRMIAGSDAPLSAIAHRCGFADHSHMTRAVRRLVGLAPSELRRL